MQSIQEELIPEIRKTPVSQLRQVLDFIKFLNQQYKQLPTENIQSEVTLAIEDDPIVLDFIKFLNQQYKQLPTENIQSEVTLAIKDDPIIGLYSGSPDLSERSEDILETEIQPQSGWTWKV